MPIQPLLLRLEMAKGTEDIWSQLFFTCNKIASKFFFTLTFISHFIFSFSFIPIFYFLFMIVIQSINYWSTIFLSIPIEYQCERRTTYRWGVHSLLTFCIVIKQSLDFSQYACYLFSAQLDVIQWLWFFKFINLRIRVFTL